MRKRPLRRNKRELRDSCMDHCNDLANMQSDCQQGTPSGGCCNCQQWGAGQSNYYNPETGNWEVTWNTGHWACHWCGESPGQCMTNCWGGSGGIVGGRYGNVSPGNWQQGGQTPLGDSDDTRGVIWCPPPCPSGMHCRRGKCHGRRRKFGRGRGGRFGSGPGGWGLRHGGHVCPRGYRMINGVCSEA